MGSLFSKKAKKGSKISEHDKAVLDLKVQRDKLKQYHKKCNMVIAKEVELARKLMQEGKKKQALLAMKKKKYQEQLLSKTDAQLQNISEMIDTIEFAQIEQKVFEGLKEGNEVLKEIHSQMSLDEIDNLMLDTQEAIDYQNQVEEALAGKLTEEEEEGILEELAKLEQETLSSQLPDVPQEVLPEHKEASIAPVSDAITRSEGPKTRMQPEALLS